jgi:hypothetical protein
MQANYNLKKYPHEKDVHYSSVRKSTFVHKKLTFLFAKLLFFKLHTKITFLHVNLNIVKYWDLGGGIWGWPVRGCIKGGGQPF